MSLKRTIQFFGGTAVVTFKTPSNEELNTHDNNIKAAVDNADLRMQRAIFFDRMAETIDGMQKGDIPDAIKAATVVRTFEYVQVDEKN